MALRDVCLGVLFGIVLGLAMGLSIGLVLDVNDLERWVVNLLSSGKQMATEALSTATSAWDYSELSEYLSGGAVINWTAVEESISSPKLSEAITEAQAAVLEQLSALDEQIDISYYEAQAEEYAQQVIDSMASNLWWVGLLLDGVATLAGTGGKQMLRYAAVSRNAWWYPFGLILTAVVDPAFDLVAYSFAAQSIIAAAAGLVVVWNVLLAPCTLGEQLTFSRKLGAALICTGTVLVGVFGSHEDPQRTPVEYLELFTRAEACYYYLAFAAWGAMCLGVRCCGPPQLGAFLVCAFGGSLAGCSFTTKAAVELTECGALDPGCPGNPFASPLFYLFAGASLVTASLSLLLLAISLRGFEALYAEATARSHQLALGPCSRPPCRAAPLACQCQPRGVASYGHSLPLRPRALHRYMITVYQGFFVLSGALSGVCARALQPLLLAAAAVLPCGAWLTAARAHAYAVVCVHTEFCDE